MKKIFSIAVVVALLSLTQNLFAGSYVGVMKGTIKDAYPTHTNDTYIKIKTGYGECNGNYFEIPSDIDLELDSGSPTGENFYYIYVNDSNDDYPTLNNTSFYDSTTEPAWSDAKQGWYNSNDRCIGSVWVNSSNVIENFTSICYGNIVEISGLGVNFASGVTGTGSWVDLDGTGGTVNSANYVPVNAIAVKFWTRGHNTNSNYSMQISSAESHSGRDFRFAGYNQTGATGWAILEESRQIAYYTQTYNDGLYIYEHGWKTKR